jgi:hypothetical protein
MYEGDVDKATEEIKEIAKKYDYDLEDPKYVERKNQSVASALKNIKDQPKCEGVDEGEVKKKLEAYYDMGNMYADVYNDTVSEQLFVNEQYKYTKTKGLNVNRTDGVTKFARLVFAFSAGKWSCDGKPGNVLPTRFKND